MPDDLRCSVLVLPNAPWDEFLRRCRHVEEAGYDGIGFADHLVDWAGGTGPWFELWTQMTAVAMVTERVRLCSLVAQFPLRNPAMLALQALTVDHASGGRLDLGLGIGLEIDPSYRMAGIENLPARERVARFGEYVELVGRLLAEEDVTYEGRHVRCEGTTLRPRPVQAPRPPLVVAAMGPVMLGHAVRQADVWNSLSFAKTHDEQLAELTARVALVDERCAAIGRDPATLRRSYLMYDPTARASGGAIAYYESEEAFVRLVEPVLALGITEIGLYYPTVERQRPVFEAIARDVLPGLRARPA